MGTTALDSSLILFWEQFLDGYYDNKNELYLTILINLWTM